MRRFGHIQRLEGNRYRVYWPENGVKRSHRMEGTLKDAELFLARKRIETGGTVPDCLMRDYWRIAVVPTFGNLAQRTAYDYSRRWQHDLEPRFGNVPVSSITWRYAESALATIESPIVQRDAFRLLKKVLNMAVRDGLISSNPVAGGVKLKPYRKREKTLYDRDTVRDVLARAIGFKHYPLIVMELGCGLRHEEACAVTRSDVSVLEYRERLYASVSVSKALTSVDSKKVLKDTKTAFSGREVLLGGALRDALLATKDRLPIDTGEQSSPVTISHNWKRYATNNGIPYIPFANMRTNYSVLHAEAGSLDSLVSLSLGHSDGTTRGRHYMEQTRAGLVLIVDNLSEYIGSVPFGTSN